MNDLLEKAQPKLNLESQKVMIKMSEKYKWVCQKCGKDVEGDYSEVDGFSAFKTNCECYIYGVEAKEVEQ